MNFSRVPTKFGWNIIEKQVKRNAQGCIKVIVVDEIEQPRFQEKRRQDVSYEAFSKKLAFWTIIISQCLTIHSGIAFLIVAGCLWKKKKKNLLNFFGLFPLDVPKILKSLWEARRTKKRTLGYKRYYYVSKNIIKLSSDVVLAASPLKSARIFSSFARNIPSNVTLSKWWDQINFFSVSCYIFLFKRALNYVEFFFRDTFSFGFSTC